ncbi:MAG: cation:proton antiporter, partial [Actinomycetota bacterium]|nr:cation:proton antiporter [Actinomycetota bacterium]
MTRPFAGLVAAAGRSPDDIAAITFIDVALVMVAARLTGAAFKRIRQPAVVGEIVAGILLGPSLLGAFPGHLTDRIFPSDIVPYLNDLAQLGLVIFMFIVGLELDSNLMRGRARLAASVSLTSIMLPFALGIGLALGLHGSHHLVRGPAGVVHDVKLLPFVLFIGASMSVTAFPVLARILTERGMYRTPLGAIALACAAVDDVAAWTLLAVVLAVVSSSHLLHVPVVLVETAAFVAAMLLLVRPALGRVIDHYRARDRGHGDGSVSPELMTVMLLGILVSSFVTERIGIHQIFGAFIFGVAVPRQTGGRLVAGVVERLESLTVLLLLPVFFVVSGLNANVRAIGASGLGQLALILLVAIGGKFLGASLAARANRMPGRRAAALGVLMNTRGLTELVILNVGQSFGVLDRQLFTLLVVMAVVTTMMTEPLLRLVYPDRLLHADLADAERAALGDPGYRVLALVDDPDGAAALIDVAADLASSAGSGLGTVVVSHFVLRQSERLFGAGMSVELAQMADLLERLSTACQHRPGQVFQPAALFTDDIAGESLRQAVRLHSDVVVLPWPGPQWHPFSGSGSGSGS